MSAYTLVAALLLAAPAVKDKSKPAEAPPTGEWVAEKVEQGGKDLMQSLGGLSMTFQDGTVVLRMSGADHSMPVAFDPAARVKEITLRPTGPNGPSRGIYKVEGDTLTIYLNEKFDGPRPTEFTDPAPGHTLFVLKRAKK